MTVDDRTQLMCDLRDAAGEQQTLSELLFEAASAVDDTYDSDMLYAAFRAGFAVSGEGWNGECVGRKATLTLDHDLTLACDKWLTAASRSDPSEPSGGVALRAAMLDEHKAAMTQTLLLTQGLRAKPTWRRRIRALFARFASWAVGSTTG